MEIAYHWQHSRVGPPGKGLPQFLWSVIMLSRHDNVCAYGSLLERSRSIRLVQEQPFTLGPQDR